MMMMMGYSMDIQRRSGYSLGGGDLGIDFVCFYLVYASERCFEEGG